MGLFSKLFGKGEPQLPPLDMSSKEAQLLGGFNAQLEALFSKINDRFEAVPLENAVYVFLGNPPGMFGVAWFLSGNAEEHNLKKLMAKKGLTQRKMDALMLKIRTAYTEAEQAPRFLTDIAGRKVIVAASPEFGARLHQILHVMDE